MLLTCFLFDSFACMHVSQFQFPLLVKGRILTSICLIRSLVWHVLAFYIMIFHLTVLVSAVQGMNLRGDCTSGGNCITPISIDMPSKLNPATIVTNTDNNGFVSAQTIAGDIPDVGKETSYNADESEQDIALRFTITSPQLEPPPAPPAMITCDYDSCTTSTTLPPQQAR